MRILYIIIGLVFVMGIFACSDDTGNYDYRELNKVTLSGLANEYNVDQYDTLRINDLELNFSIKENADLSYEWVMRRVNSDLNTARVVSVERNCKGYIEEMPGLYTAYLCVTDNTNDLKYYHEFNVIVNTVWANGLFVLSEAKDGTAMLSMQRRDKPDASLKYDVFEMNNPDFGQLGRKPVQVYEGGTGGGVYIVCQEGERKLLKLNEDDLKLLQYWDESTVGDYSGTFVPEYFSNEQGNGMVLSEGKLFLFNYADNNMLYKPIEGYDFSWVGTSPSLAGEYYYAFDETSQTFKKLEKNKNPLLYDKVTTLEELNSAGQTYLASGVMKTGDYDWIQYPVLYDPATGMEHYYEIHIGGDYDYETWEYIEFFNYSEKMTRSATLDKDGVCLLSKNSYWYASRGNKVIRYYFSERSVAQDWITDLKGRVTEMIFGADESRIFVATYDGAKSYIYEIDARNANKHLNAPIELEGKVVSLCVVNGHKWVY